MQKPIRIERRLPFGFKGDWGRLYKRYTVPSGIKLVADETEVIEFERNFYKDIGQPVQFREAADETGSVELPSTGLLVDTAYITARTTDSYWNAKLKRWDCVVNQDDIIEFLGRRWIVVSVNNRVARRTPAMLLVFYCDLKSIL